MAYQLEPPYRGGTNRITLNPPGFCVRKDRARASPAGLTAGGELHFHMLFLDGGYLLEREAPVFRRLPAPRPQALEGLLQTISQRAGACLEREGLLVRDIEIRANRIQFDVPHANQQVGIGVDETGLIAPLP